MVQVSQQVYAAAENGGSTFHSSMIQQYKKPEMAFVSAFCTRQIWKHYKDIFSDVAQHLRTGKQLEFLVININFTSLFLFLLQSEEHKLDFQR